jgi:hypothetical protein
LSRGDQLKVVRSAQRPRLIGIQVKITSSILSPDQGRQLTKRNSSSEERAEETGRQRKLLTTGKTADHRKKLFEGNS